MENNPKQIVPDPALMTARIGRKEMPAIHTMPKRFISTPTGKTKSANSHTGLIVLIIGVLVLLGAFVGLYIYFSSAAKTPLPAPTAAEPAETAETDVVKNVPSAPESVPETIREVPVKAQPATTTAPRPATPEEIEEQIASTTVPNIPRTLAAAVDSDGDGLSDSEELMLDANPALADSDGDGYNDRDEMMNLYNPAGAGKLIVNPNIKKYVNGTYGYSLYHPLGFTAEGIGGDESVMFRAGNNQFFQVIVQPNREDIGVDAWYKETFSAAFITAEQTVIKPGWTGVRSTDGLTYYLKSTKRPEIITLAYNIGLESTLHYKQLFELMVKSLEVGG